MAAKVEMAGSLTARVGVTGEGGRTEEAHVCEPVAEGRLRSATLRELAASASDHAAQGNIAVRAMLRAFPLPGAP
eukprot:2968535-Rhodomonas_salina.4